MAGRKIKDVTSAVAGLGANYKIPISDGTSAAKVITGETLKNGVGAWKLVEDGASTSVTLDAMACDTMYKYGTLSQLAITSLAAAPNDGLQHVYVCQFVSGATATNLGTPDTWEWSGSCTPSANKSCELSVINGKATLTEYE